MSPEHDNNLQPTLEMSAPESGAGAPEGAAPQTSISSGSGTATAAVRVPEAASSARVVEENLAKSVSSDGHGASAAVPAASGTEEKQAEVAAHHEAAAEVPAETAEHET